MACDPNTLLDNARCIESCLTYGQMDAVETYLWCVVAGGVTPPAETFHILTELGDNIAAENGDLLRTE